jgi:hypothetical protein
VKGAPLAVFEYIYKAFDPTNPTIFVPDGFTAIEVRPEASALIYAGV